MLPDIAWWYKWSNHYFYLVIQTKQNKTPSCFISRKTCATKKLANEKSTVFIIYNYIHNKIYLKQNLLGQILMIYFYVSRLIMLLTSVCNLYSVVW